MGAGSPPAPRLPRGSPWATRSPAGRGHSVGEGLGWGLHPACPHSPSSQGEKEDGDWGRPFTGSRTPPAWTRWGPHMASPHPAPAAPSPALGGEATAPSRARAHTSPRRLAPAGPNPAERKQWKITKKAQKKKKITLPREGNKAPRAEALAQPWGGAAQGTGQQGGAAAAEPGRDTGPGAGGGQRGGRVEVMVSASSSWMVSSSSLCTACVMSVSSWHSVSKR